MENSFPLRILKSLYIYIFFSLFIQIKLFDFEIDKEMERYQHVPLFL